MSYRVRSALRCREFVFPSLLVPLHLRAVDTLLLLTLTLTFGPSIEAHQPPVRVAKPEGPDGFTNGCFGFSVALSGNYAFVGDPCDRTAGLEVGTAYRLRRRGTGWIVDQQLVSSYPVDSGGFGKALAVHGPTLAIGAPGENSSGSVYTFSNATSASGAVLNWVYASSDAGAGYGASVAANYGLFKGFIAGAPHGTCSGATSTGRGYAIAVPGITYPVCAVESSSQGGFGASIATMSGANQALIGAPSGTIGGGAYLWDLGIPGISPPKVISAFFPTDANQHRLFGASLTMSDATIVIGAPMDGNVGIGQVWLYGGAIPNWLTEAILSEPVATPSSQFGASVVLDGEVLFVGSPNTLVGGAVYQYSRDVAGWTLADTFAADDADGTGAALGSSVAVDSLTWIAGAPQATPNLVIAGAVYISADDYMFIGDFDL